MLAHLKESETLLTESMKFNVDYGRYSHFIHIPVRIILY